MLKYSYEAMIRHCDKPLMHEQKNLKSELEILDARRSVDSKKVFPEIYEKVIN
jgi:hypothetical protein